MSTAERGPINTQPVHMDRRVESFYEMLESALRRGDIVEAAEKANLILQMMDRGSSHPSKFTGPADAGSILRYVRGLADA